MLPEGLLLLDPLEYPPPYPPPPRALAKERDGSPIRAMTITAAMSFVVFMVASFLSMSQVTYPQVIILAEIAP
jgi:hypothetical protein